MKKPKSKMRTKKAGSPMRAKRLKTPTPAKGNLSGASVAELQAELKRRQQRVRPLMRRHDRLMKHAAALRAEIEAFGGSATAVGEPARRPRDGMSLIATLKRVLSGKTLSVEEAAKSATEAGYRSSSPHFRVLVNRALATSDAFKRVGRGRYTAK